MISFGTGIVSIIPAGTNPTPANIGILQDVSVDISYSEKELRGAFQFAVDVARAGAKIAAKAKSGQFNAALLANFLTGASNSVGSKIGIANESGTIPTTPFQITVANGATFYEDLGVFDTTTGLWMVRGATATGTGVYAVNTATGVYTFHTSDSTHGVQISYSYTAAAVGRTVAMTNQLMGSATTFTLTLFNTYKGKSSGIRLWAVTSTKLSMALKNEDHTLTDIDFTAQADSSGRVIDMYAAD